MTLIGSSRMQTSGGDGAAELQIDPAARSFLAQVTLAPVQTLSRARAHQ